MNGFHHEVDITAPRYNTVEKPITIERALQLKLQRIQEAEEELRRAILEPLATVEIEFVKVG